MKNFYSKEVQNFIKVLQKTYNVLMIYDPHDLQNDKLLFIVDSFIPAQNMVTYHVLRGRDITEMVRGGDYDRNLIVDEMVQGQYNIASQSQSLVTKVDGVPIRFYQFSKDFSFIWYLIS